MQSAKEFNGHVLNREQQNGLDGRAPSADSSELMTLHEVATELRCSKAHVSNLIKGRIRNVSALPALSLGRRKLVLRGTLERWKRANEHRGDSAKILPSPRVGAVNA